jgi:hypothetical protein
MWQPKYPPPPPKVFCELSAEFGRTIPKIYDLRVLVCAVLLYRILLFLCVGEIQSYNYLKNLSRSWTFRAKALHRGVTVVN